MFDKLTHVTRCVPVFMLLIAPATSASAQNKVKVVTTLPTYAALAREIAGDLGDVESIARGDVDPHFVNARPSFAAMIRSADVFVSTGLDLELWAPALLDRANNPNVLEGAPGHVTAYSGVRLLDVPQNVSRTGGDVHAFGNPHVHTDPVNAVIIASNIANGLKRVDAANAATYDANLANFRTRIMNRLFGTELVGILGEDVLFQLASTGEFWNFAAQQTLRDKPLTDYIGGWLEQGSSFRDRTMVCYHKNWTYFSERFRIPCAMYVEPKPGIPASPRHVGDVVDFIRAEHIPVVFAANYFSRTQVERVASRTGAVAVIVPEHVSGAEGVDDYFTLVDTWVTALAAVFRESSE